MQDKHIANILQEELKLACQLAGGEFVRVYGHRWEFELHEVQHNQKVEGQPHVPSTVITLNLLTTFPELPGAHKREDKGEPIYYKKLWQQAFEVRGNKLVESRVFAYRQLLSSLVTGFLSALVYLEPEELEAISTNPN